VPTRYVLVAIGPALRHIGLHLLEDLRQTV